MLKLETWLRFETTLRFETVPRFATDGMRTATDKIRIYINGLITLTTVLRNVSGRKGGHNDGPSSRVYSTGLYV